MVQVDLELSKDAWLESILKTPAFNVTPNAASATSVAKPGFYYAKVDTSDISQVQRLEQLGFLLIDTNVTFTKKLDRSGAHEASSIGLSFHFADSADAAPVGAIATSVFTKSRFHLDPAIDASTASEIKRQWVLNFFSSTSKRGDALVVAKKDSKVIGFLLLLYAGEKLVIDLVGVASDQQGQGAGRGMIAFAEDRCAQKNKNLMHYQVGTQVSNTESIRFYENLGFRLTSAQYVFHKHVRD